MDHVSCHLYDTTSDWPYWIIAHMYNECMTCSNDINHPTYQPDYPILLVRLIEEHVVSTWI